MTDRRYALAGSPDVEQLQAQGYRIVALEGARDEQQVAVMERRL
jgi:hypothetical protein